MMDEEDVVEDHDIHRLWTVAVIAKEFHVLPSVVARDLDEDPERLSLVCLQLLRYAEAKDAWDSNNKDRIKAFSGSDMMKRVQEYEFDLVQKSMGV